MSEQWWKGDSGPDVPAGQAVLWVSKDEGFALPEPVVDAILRDHELAQKAEEYKDYLVRIGEYRGYFGKEGIAAQEARSAFGDSLPALAYEAAKRKERLEAAEAERDQWKARGELAVWFRETLRHVDSGGHFVGGDAAIEALEFVRRFDALKAEAEGK